MTLDPRTARVLRRLVDLLDGDCTLPDGSNADTMEAHALLGDFDKDAPDCILCGLRTAADDRVVGQASGPGGVILHDNEIAHGSCLRAVRGY